MVLILFYIRCIVVFVGLHQSFRCHLVSLLYQKMFIQFDATEKLDGNKNSDAGQQTQQIQRM